MKAIGKRIGVGFAAGLFALAVLVVQPARAAEGDPSFRGTNGYGIDFSGGWGWSSSAEKEASLTEADTLGVDWVRLNAFWYQIQEEGQLSYDWSLLDAQVAAATAHSKRVLLVAHTTPDWARPAGAPSGDAGNKFAPQNPAHYAMFMSKLVERYAPQGVLDYEVWNEPNLTNFWKDSVEDPNPNAARYADLLSAASGAMRAENAAVNVIMGGMAPAGGVLGSAAVDPRTYLDALYDEGAGGSFDAVAMHPYSYPALPSVAADWNPWQQMFNDSLAGPDSLRTIMTNNGDAAKKIWLTEFGAPTEGGPNAVTEAMQRDIYTEAIALHKSYAWVGPMFFYTLDDWAAYGDETDREYYFGLRRFDGTYKGSFAAVQNAITDTTGPVVGAYNPSLPGTTWSGTVTLQPTVSDNVAVDRVQLVIDGVVVATDANAPYVFSIDTSTFTPGSSHTVVVRAFDTSDNQTNGSAFTFTVAAATGGGDDGAEVPGGVTGGGNTTAGDIIPGVPNTGLVRTGIAALAVLVLLAGAAAGTYVLWRYRASRT